MAQKAGIIGVGLMGHGIASNVLKFGWQLNFLHHEGNQPTEDLVNAGASRCMTIKDVCAGADFVILCVTGAPQVEAVILGEDGVAANIADDAIVIDCSTSLPETTVKVAAAIHAANARYIDAPMTRTPKEAAEGRLNLLVGGGETDFASARPLMETFAENITHTGPVGSGHAMKLLHNFVSLSLMGVVAEAASCAKKAMVEPEVFVDVLRTGGGYGAALDRLEPMILSGDPSALKFTLSNAQKDIGYYAGMAESMGASDQMASAMARKLQAAISDLSEEAFVPELVKL